MFRFFHRYRVVLSCGFFLLVSLGLAAVNRRASYPIDPVGVVLLEVMHPLQSGVTTASHHVGLAWDLDEQDLFALGDHAHHVADVRPAEAQDVNPHGQIRPELDERLPAAGDARDDDLPLVSVGVCEELHVIGDALGDVRIAVEAA